MALANIVDHRTNQLNVQCDAVIEASCHDNGIVGATQFNRHNEGFVKEYSDITVKKAVKLARKSEGNITVFLYDPHQII